MQVSAIPVKEGGFSMKVLAYTLSAAIALAIRALAVLGLACPLAFGATEKLNIRVYDVRAHGATGDGIVVNRFSATGVYEAAASIESWTETPVGRVVFRDVSIEYTGGGAAEDGAKAARRPGVDARPLPAWGFFARNAREVVLEDIRLGCERKDLRPVLIARDVRRLVLDELRYPRFPEVEEPLFLKDVDTVDRGTEVPERQRSRR
jgi:hypothetical protein